MAADAFAEADATTTADVIIVGYGPVGQTLSTLLAIAGHRVLALERQPAPFPQPRAVSVDGYAARVLTACGVGETLAAIGEPTPDSLIVSAGDETLMRLVLSEVGPNGWPMSTSMYQPGLEEGLAQRGELLETLSVVRGAEVLGVVDGTADASVTFRVDGREAIARARWVVGCDGANSVVREAIAPPVTDSGFDADWLACDVLAAQPAGLPSRTLHVADPSGPRLAVSAGPGHYRFEFLRLEHESPAAFASPERAWQGLARFDVDPSVATLERHAVYRLRSRCVEQWRDGHVLLAGDAAHEMPPFAGQGLSCGIGDAAAVAWRLSAVLAGAPDRLLDSYGPERLPQVNKAITTSVRLGGMICITDPFAAASRDLAMRKMSSMPRATAMQDPITAGFVSGGTGGSPPASPTGWLAPVTALGDVPVGTGDGLHHRVLVLREAADELDDAARGELQRLGVKLLLADDAGISWLDEFGMIAALVRPDFYVFGAVADGVALRALVADYAQQLICSAARPHR